MKDKTQNSKICSLCGKEIDDLVRDGNNAFPFIGTCCHECNFRIVIPVRIALLQRNALLFRASNENSKSGLEVIAHPEKLTLEDLQEYVGGYIETIYLQDDYVAIVNEEGKLKNLPINKAWSMFYLSSNIPTLVGNVLLMKKDQLK